MVHTFRYYHPNRCHSYQSSYSPTDIKKIVKGFEVARIYLINLVMCAYDALIPFECHRIQPSTTASHSNIIEFTLTLTVQMVGKHSWLCVTSKVLSVLFPNQKFDFITILLASTFINQSWKLLYYGSKMYRVEWPYLKYAYKKEWVYNTQRFSSGFVQV